jgi:hypothetical protein
MLLSRTHPHSYIAASALAVAMAVSLQYFSFVVGHKAVPERMLRVADPSQPEREKGFDGQFFLALAKDPLVGPATARALDSPALRAQRIGLPLIAWLLAPLVGGAAAGLLLAETLFLFLLVALVQSGARRQGLPPFLCPAVVLLLPFALSMELVTSELPTAAVLLLAANEHRRGNHRSALVTLGAACLFKEVAVIAVAASAAISLFSGRRRECALCLASTLPLIGWQAYLGLRFREIDGSSGLLSNLGPPGRGLADALLNPLADIAVAGFHPKPLALLAAVLWYATGGVYAIILLKKGISAGRLIACFGAAFVVFLSYGGSAQAYNEIFNFGRQLFLLVVGLLMVLLYEAASLSRRERAFITVWLMLGSGLGVSWWIQKILTS